jgi:hypothetical protein
MTFPIDADRSRTFDLAHEQVLVIDDRPGTRLQVLDGGLWLTEERSLEDRFGSAGQWLQLEARGRAVAEALGRTRVRVVEPARPGGAWRAALRRWRTRHGRTTARALAAPSAAVVLSLVLGVGLPEMLARSLQHTAAHPAASVASAPSPADDRA